MKKFLGVLLGLGLCIGLELWAMDSDASAQAKPVTYIVCDSNNALVQTLKTSGPVTITASVVGPEGGAVYYSVYAETTPSSCANVMLEYEGTGSFPPGDARSRYQSHKPVLK